MIVKIGGVHYKSIPDVFTCEGCVANFNDALCKKLDTSEGRCVQHNVIWMRKDKTVEPKEEITRLEKLNMAEEMLHEFRLDHITKHRLFCEWIDDERKKTERNNDPEYQKYLELKAKYAD